MKKIEKLLIFTMCFYILAGGFTAIYVYMKDAPKAPVEAAAPVEEVKEVPKQPAKPVEIPKAEEPVAAPEEPEAEETIVSETKYYAFITTNTQYLLRVRQTPDINGEIIGKLEPSSTGYLLEAGTEWSKVEVNGLTGYVATEYIDTYEITKEQFDQR